MDTFDLKWPKTDATFYTDGWRCRIVWRQRSGMGGTIDNNLQCKKRVADSLVGAPYLLSALKARGHGNLATEIEGLVAPTDMPAAEMKVVSRAVPRAAPRAVPRTPSTSETLAAWLALLEGSGHFETVNARRAKLWQPIGELGDESLSLKVPAQKGKQEWVLKRSDSQAKREAQYVVAADLKGIVSHLGEVEESRSTAFIDGMLHACESMKHPQLAAAATAWRKLTDPAKPH